MQYVQYSSVLYDGGTNKINYFKLLEVHYWSFTRSKLKLYMFYANMQHDMHAKRTLRTSTIATKETRNQLTDTLEMFLSK